MKTSSPKYLEEIIFSKSHDGWSRIVNNYSSLKFIVWWMTLKNSKYRESTQRWILCFYNIVPRDVDETI